jgi:hypothetical protein
MIIHWGRTLMVMTTAASAASLAATIVWTVFHWGRTLMIPTAAASVASSATTIVSTVSIYPAWMMTV